MTVEDGEETLYRERYRPPWPHVAQFAGFMTLAALAGGLSPLLDPSSAALFRWLGTATLGACVVTLVFCAVDIPRGMMVRVTRDTIVVGSTRFARRVPTEKVVWCEPAQMDWFRRVRHGRGEPWGGPAAKLTRSHTLVPGFWPPWRGVLMLMTAGTTTFIASRKAEEQARAIQEQVAALRERSALTPGTAP